MKLIVVVVLFFAVTMPVVYLLGPQPSLSQMVQSVTQPKARAPLPPGSGTHTSTAAARALERHPAMSVLLGISFIVAIIVLAFAIGVLVYKVIGPVKARPGRRVL